MSVPAKASGFVAVLLCLVLTREVVSVRPFNSQQDPVADKGASGEQEATVELNKAESSLSDIAGDNQTENQNDTAQVAQSANGQGAHATSEGEKGQAQVTELTATVRETAEEENVTELSKTNVQKVTVKEKFKAGDRPGVKLDYHPGFGSEIWVRGCNEKGAWRKTHSLLNKYTLVYVKAINELDAEDRPINKIDVEDADPQVVTELWAALINGSKNYEVTFSTEKAEKSLACYVGLCTLPWLIATFMACCALPCAIRRIYQETALEEVGKDEEDSREEPVPRLRGCLMSRVAEHPVTRLSLVAFAVGTTLLALMTYLPLASHAPTTCAIAMGPIVLFAGIAVFVAVGVKATEGNALLEDGDMCPRGLTEALKAEFKYVLLALAPSLVYVYVLVVFWIWIFMPCQLISEGPREFLRFLTHSQYPLKFGPHLLIYVCIPHFLLKSHILARTVTEHVRSVNRELEEIHNLEKEKKGEGHKRLQTEMKKIHEACIRLRMEVLPNLKGIAVPTLGFAACTWGWVLMTIVAYLSGEAGESATETDQNRPDYMIAISVAAMMVMFLPLGVMCLLPPAAVSDAFDNLLDCLNRLRALDGLENDDQIRLTESYIKESNRGQGLGFVLFGTVINTRFISASTIKLAASASFLLSFFYHILIKYSVPRKLLSEVPGWTTENLTIVTAQQKKGERCRPGVNDDVCKCGLCCLVCLFHPSALELSDSVVGANGCCVATRIAGQDQGWWEEGRPCCFGIWTICVAFIFSQKNMLHTHWYDLSTQHMLQYSQLYCTGSKHPLAWTYRFCFNGASGRFAHVFDSAAPTFAQKCIDHQTPDKERTGTFHWNCQ